jgi:hypothetical protein
VLDLPSLCTLGLQPVETGPIDGLERQSVLKALVRRGVELAGGQKRPLPFKLGPVALEAERPWLAARGSWLASHAPELLTACWAHRLRAFAFELTARKRNPFTINRLIRRAKHLTS